MSSDFEPGLARLSYQEIADRYDLETLKIGADFAYSEAGDLINLNGNMQIGDVTHNALYRFVISWQFNAPMLKTLFDFVDVSGQRRRQHKNELDSVVSKVTSVRSRVTLSREERAAAIDRWHELDHEIGIEEIGPQACAGAIMVVLKSLLRSEWLNLGRPERWDTAGALVAGFSFGRIVEASSNCFRHVDEWVLASPPTSQQRWSMDPIIAAIGSGSPKPGMHFAFWGNACTEVLSRLSGGSFEGLMDATFTFALALTLGS